MATMGEKIVRVNFNASGDSAIDNIKKSFAEHIDNAASIAEAKYKRIEGTEDPSDVIDIERDNDVMLELFKKLVSVLEDASGLYVKLITAP